VLFVWMFQLRVLDGVGQQTSGSTHAYWWQLQGSPSWSAQSQVAERFVCQHRQTVHCWRTSNETTAVQMHFARSASVLYRCTEHIGTWRVKVFVTYVVKERQMLEAYRPKVTIGRLTSSAFVYVAVAAASPPRHALTFLSLYNPSIKENLPDAT